MALFVFVAYYVRSKIGFLLTFKPHLGFLVAVVLASASTAMWELIACRALMGLSAAFIMPSTLSILVNVFPPGERKRAKATVIASSQNVPTMKT